MFKEINWIDCTTIMIPSGLAGAPSGVSLFAIRYFSSSFHFGVPKHREERVFHLIKNEFFISITSLQYLVNLSVQNS